MKTLFFACFFLSCQAAFSLTPKVGDTALYQTVDKSDTTLGGQFTMTETLSNYDNAKGTYTVDADFKGINGVQAHGSMEMDGKDLGNLYYIQNIQQFCNDRGGSLENITVPAGTFSACKIDGGTAVEWISDQVPFGHVKSLQYDSKNQLIEEQTLIKFTLAPAAK